MFVALLSACEDEPVARPGFGEIVYEGNRRIRDAIECDGSFVFVLAPREDVLGNVSGGNEIWAVLPDRSRLELATELSERPLLRRCIDDQLYWSTGVYESTVVRHWRRRLVADASVEEAAVGAEWRLMYDGNYYRSEVIHPVPPPPQPGDTGGPPPPSSLVVVERTDFDSGVITRVPSGPIGGSQRRFSLVRPDFVYSVSDHEWWRWNREADSPWEYLGGFPYSSSLRASGDRVWVNTNDAVFTEVRSLDNHRVMAANYADGCGPISDFRRVGQWYMFMRGWRDGNRRCASVWVSGSMENGEVYLGEAQSDYSDRVLSFFPPSGDRTIYNSVRVGAELFIWDGDFTRDERRIRVFPLPTFPCTDALLPCPDGVECVETACSTGDP